MAKRVEGGLSLGGYCDEHFAAVRHAFAENFLEHDEIGGAVAVILNSRVVVDLYGGHVDARRTELWQPDTLVDVYSVGKAVLAVLTLILVERGMVELDAPVTRYWPEFGAHDKGALTVRGLLAHRAGLPAIRRRLPDDALFDWRVMCDALAAEAPFWAPGQAHGYHVNTYGFLVGEVVRRVTGVPVGEAVRRYVAGPIGAAFAFGVRRAQQQRIAAVCGPSTMPVVPERWSELFPPTGDAERDLMTWHTYFNPNGLCGAGIVNSPEWRAAEIPSANGHATARAVAAIYAAFLAGGPQGARWVGPTLRAEAVTMHSDGADTVIGRHSRFGLGFQLPHPERAIGPNARAFGHYGYGGSLGFADPDAGLAFGYLTNHPSTRRWSAPRAQRLIDAVYASL